MINLNFSLFVTKVKPSTHLNRMARDRSIGQRVELRGIELGESTENSPVCTG